MKVDIAGAGVAGSYLGRLLKGSATLFDDNPTPGCGCAWGTARSQVRELLRDVGLRLSDYVLCEVDGAIRNNVYTPCGNLIVIDKPKLIRDLRSGLTIRRKRYSFGDREGDLVVNATAVPSGREVFSLDTLQTRTGIIGAEKKTIYAYINPNHAGYSWIFPLDEDGRSFHLGAACIGIQPERLVRQILTYYKLSAENSSCGCDKKLHVADPRNVDLVKGNVVAVGGAAGCVNPITGEGILSSMFSAKLLTQTLDEGGDLSSYASSLRKYLSGHDKAYRIFRQMLVIPGLAWLGGLRYNAVEALEHFEPELGRGQLTKLLLNSTLIALRNIV